MTYDVRMQFFGGLKFNNPKSKPMYVRACVCIHACMCITITHYLFCKKNLTSEIQAKQTTNMLNSKIQ